MRERKRDKNRLEDILKCIDNVRQFVRDIDFETFVADTMRYYQTPLNKI